LVCGTDKLLKSTNYQGLKQWFDNQDPAPFVFPQRLVLPLRGISIPEKCETLNTGKISADEKCSWSASKANPAFVAHTYSMKIWFSFSIVILSQKGHLLKDKSPWKLRKIIKGGILVHVPQ